MLKAVKWFMLVMPIIVLFYYENGLDLHQVFVVQAVYSVTIVVLEIPSGYIADIFGRKKTLFIGSIFGFLGYVIYCLSDHFHEFMIAEIVLGIGHSFISGADSAMLYDTLYSNDKKNEYTKFEGRVSSIGNFSEGTAGVLGGLMALISLRTPFYIQTIILFLAIPASLLLVEPEKHEFKGKPTITQFLKNIKYAFEHRLLFLYLLLSSITGTATLTFAWFVQPYFKSIDVPLKFYGILWTLLNLSVGIMSILSYKFEKQVGRK
ncbi:MFS transporter, partial [Bacteroidota bacterium]